MIIGLGYKARSGKDTVGEYLADEYGFYKTSFAAALRRSISDTLGIQIYTEEDKLQPYAMWGNRTGREILQQYGTNGLRNGFDKDIWVKLALYKSPTFSPRFNEYQLVVFTDMRFENEADEIKKLGGILIRIDRDQGGLKGNEATHPSETGLDEYSDWDYILVNNGSLDDLYDGVDVIMNQLNIEKF